MNWCLCILVYCCPSTISSLWPPPPSPLPKLNVQFIQTVCVWGGGDGGWIVLCRPYSAGILHSVSDQMQNLPNYVTTPNKMTSENDIKGLVSFKFLRPWLAGSAPAFSDSLPFLWTVQSPYFEMFMGPRNWFQGMNSASLYSLAGRYDNPIPPRFLAPIDFLKIPALYTLVMTKTFWYRSHICLIENRLFRFGPESALLDQI